MNPRITWAATGALLLLVVFYIFFVVLSYDHAWMNPEAYAIESFTLSKNLGVVDDLKRSFDYREFEYAPRVGRPLSSIFSVFDTRLRVWAWHYFTPHPSASLTWIFSLLLSPICLAALLRNLRVKLPLCVLGVTTYLISPCFLSLLAMNFRPAKAMVNFCLLLLLYLASRLPRPFRNRKETRRSLGQFSLFCGFLMTSFFWDETGLLAYVLIPLFFPELFANKIRILIYFATAAIYVFIYKVALLKWIGYLGYPIPDPAAYGPMNDIFTLPSQLFYKARLLTEESAGLFDPRSPKHWVGRFIFGFHLLWSLVFIAGVAKNWRLFGKGNPILSKALLACGVSLLFYGYLMTIGKNYGWGPYWYGTYWSIVFTILLILYANAVQGRMRGLTVGWIISLHVALAYSFPFTNQVYKKYHFYPYSAVTISEFFYDNLNRFEEDALPTEDLYGLTKYFYQKMKRGESVRGFVLPKELAYLDLELGPTVELFSPFEIQKRAREYFHIVGE